MDCLYLVTPRVSPGGGGGGDLTGLTGSGGIVITNPGGPVPDVGLPPGTVDGQVFVWDQPTLTWGPSAAVVAALNDVLTWNGVNWQPLAASGTPTGPAGGDLAATAVDPVSDYPNPIVSGATHIFTDLEFNQPADAGINHNTPGGRIYSLDQWTLGGATPIQSGFQLSLDAPDRFGLSVTGPQADAGASIQMQTHTAGVIVHDWELLATGAGASQGAGKWNLRYIPLGVLGDWLTVVGATGFVGLGLNTGPGERLDVVGNIRVNSTGEYRAVGDLVLRCAAANVIRFSDATPLDMCTLFEGGGQVRLELAAGRLAMSWFADDLNQDLILRSGTGTGGTYSDQQTFNLRDQGGTQRVAWSTAAAMTLTLAATITSFALSHTQAAAGAGGAMSISAQRGAAGSIGGRLTLGAGQGGTLGTNLAGGIDLDVGQAVAASTSLLRILGGATGVVGQHSLSASSYLIAGGAAATAGVRLQSTVFSVTVQSPTLINLEVAAAVGASLQLSSAKTVSWVEGAANVYVWTIDANGANMLVWQAAVTSVSESFGVSAGAGAPWVMTGQGGAAGQAGGLIRIAAGDGGAGAGGDGADLDLRSGGGNTSGDVTIRYGSQTAIMIEGTGNTGRVTIGEGGFAGTHAINSTTAASGTGGGAGPIPDAEGYLPIEINGVQRLFPFINA